VDGQQVATFDGNRSAVKYQAVIGPYNLPDTRGHTITFEANCTKNPGSSGFVV
jgi:hypothetical protein